MITSSQYRKRELQELAEAISIEYFPNEIFDPTHVASYNQITFSFGNYEDAFDGLLEHRFGKFHIYLNINRVPDPHHPRMRYTFCHELAHYFIDEHRNALKFGNVSPHPSFGKLMSDNLVEREADFFASCLLMPSVKVLSFCRKKPLSSSLISSMANNFGASHSAAIFRYFDLSLFPMLIVMSRAGKIVWKMATSDFKYKYIANNGSVPVNSAAWEFFSSGTRYESEEIVYAGDWFSDYNRIKEEQFFEKCYYLRQNKVMSLIWKIEY